MADTRPTPAATWVVLPTYNERDNLQPLVAELLSFPALHILVVDDNSPDGTGQLADSIANHESRVSVLHRPGKAGLAAAYQAGFTHVLQHGAGTVIQMDADFSHPPALIGPLLAALVE